MLDAGIRRADNRTTPPARGRIAARGPARMTSRPSRAIAPLTTFAVIAAAALASAQEPSPAAARLKADVAYLADDAREGRAPGTPGIEAAAGYIADAFKAAGLKPAAGSDDYFQPFAIRGEPQLRGEPSLALAGPDGKRLEARPKVDFTPLVVGGAGSPEALPLAFAGYGITAKGGPDGLDYDDYDGLDVAGKAVLIFRHAPRQEEPDTPFHGPKGLNFAAFRHKARNAAGHGAKAVLLVNDLAGLKGKPDELLPFEAAGPPGSRIPFLMATRDFAERLLAASGLPGLEELETAQLAGKAPPRGRPLEGWTLAAKVEIERASIASKNVVGVLEGSGPRAAETVVVGAHYDHLGRGGPGSLAFGSREIHNGADDNASGTALVMELARRLGRRADPPPRRVVFVAFSGEEMGLLGSAHYVARPPYPLRDTVMMLNYDMVGRLGEKGELSVYGTTSAPGLDPLVDALGRDEGLIIRKSAGALLGDRFSLASDHASFLLRRIPYLFFFTGVHRDYHRPSDDVEAINFPGMARVADLGELVILDVVRRPARPEFLAAPTPPPHGGGDHATKDQGQDPALGGSPTAAYFGSIPDYSDSDPAGGVKLSGVRDGGPAANAGVRGGDVVVKFAGEAIDTLEDFTEAIARRKPGDAVEVVVKRDGKDLPLKVTLGSRGEAAK